jgi:hypothetical protein
MTVKGGAEGDVHGNGVAWAVQRRRLPHALLFPLFLLLLLLLHLLAHFESLRSVGCRSLSSSSSSQCTLEAPFPTAEKLSQSSQTPPTPFGTPQFGTTFHAFSLVSSCLIEGRKVKFVSVAVHTSRRRSPHTLPSYQPLPISAPDYSADLASQAPFWRQFFLCVSVEFGHVCNSIGFVEFLAVSTGSQVL